MGLFLIPFLPGDEDSRVVMVVFKSRVGKPGRKIFSGSIWESWGILGGCLSLTRVK